MHYSKTIALVEKHISWSALCVLAAKTWLRAVIISLAVLSGCCTASLAEEPVSTASPSTQTASQLQKSRDRFSLEEWKESIREDNPPGKYLSRSRLFMNFLKMHDLIGMSHSQVKTLLGNEDLNATYTIINGGDGGYGVFIVYDHERVKGWRFKSFINDKSTPLITTNVLWRGQDGTPASFTPKY